MRGTERKYPKHKLKSVVKGVALYSLINISAWLYLPVNSKLRRAYIQEKGIVVKYSIIILGVV